MTSLHWWFITASWALTLAVFAGLSVSALLRHRNARRLLARLESRTQQSRTLDTHTGGPQGGTA